MSDLRIGDARITPVITDGLLRSIGSIEIGGVPLRNPATRFLPWFDSYAGDVFREFGLIDITHRNATTVIATRALSDPDTFFQERRDTSGDLCVCSRSWDAPPIVAEFDICFEPAQTTLGGREFTGFKYWFEYRCPDLAIHRLADRQTWEVGGNLDDLSLVCRNWLTPPRMRIERETMYSTVGLGKMFGLMPGNLWGRWSLLPAFDMQYGPHGILLGSFDEVSLIRTVIESQPGEDWIRHVDIHWFEQGHAVRTNPKTILYSPDVLDDVDALNFWTRVHDREADKARRHFGLPDEEPPAVTMSISETCWVNFRLDHSYDEIMDVAAEFGVDYFGTDAIWENGQALREEIDARIPPEEQKGTLLEKFRQENMCCTFDYQVAEIFGGEAGLKRLCDRAAERGLKVLVWLGLHYSPYSYHNGNPAEKYGTFGVFAAKESGYHPDTGYAGDCWTINLNAPVREKIREQLLGVIERTGLGGFRWDSFCNLGWWQVDYSAGTMRPQIDHLMSLYTDMIGAGVRIWPEAIVSFSNQSCCGLHGGNVYADDLLGYAYNTAFPFAFGDANTPQKDYTVKILTGEEPFELLFRNFAHKRIPPLNFHYAPREQWNPQQVTLIKELIAVYRANRHLMQTRTVLKDDRGVMWENDTETNLFFNFIDQPAQVGTMDAATGKTANVMQAMRAYLVRR